MIMEKSRKAFGNMGENIAAEYFEKSGFSVICRNFRAGHLETDIICENETHIVFAEVKSRRELPSLLKYGRPAAAVTPKKARNLVECARAYLRENQTAKKPRIDVVEIYFEADGSFAGKIKHIENAVTAGS